MTSLTRNQMIGGMVFAALVIGLIIYFLNRNPSKTEPPSKKPTEKDDNKVTVTSKPKASLGRIET